MNRKTIFLAIFVISTFIFSTAFTVQTNAVEPIATLDFKTNGGGVRPDYGLYFARYLADIGIKVNVKVEEWSVFLGTLLATFNFDLGCVGLTGGAGDPDPSGVYREASSLNMFGLNREMPYGNESENMIIEGVKIMDLEERQQHYYDWQQLMMDKIVPMVPLYSPRAYTATWSNLVGYDNRWGLIESLPYMSWDGLHTGQESADEFVTHEAIWSELNPVFSLDATSSFIQAMIYEPVMQMSPDFEPLKTGLINDWEWLDDNRIRFTIRDDMYWNPSFDLTGRTSSSAPLDPAVTPLMEGIKGETSDGTNQQVTTKDVLFTYYVMSAPFSVRAEYFDWMRDIYAEDDYNFVVTIDADPETDELEPYAPFWLRVSWDLLPEFFLNGTSTDVLTSRTGHLEFIGLNGTTTTEQWQKFSSMAFGSGKYMLDWAIPTSQTELVASPYWFGIGAIDGQVQTLDIEKLVVRRIDDQTSALSEFKAGNLDIMGLTLFPADRKRMQVDPEFEVHSRLTGSFTFVGINMRRQFIGGDNNYQWLTEDGKEEYTKGTAVRKAISYAIDRVEMNNVLHDGEYILSDSPIYPVQDYWYYNDIIKYERNLEAAFEWLEAAGYEIIIPDSTPFQFGFIGLIAAVFSFIILRRRR